VAEFAVSNPAMDGKMRGCGRVRAGDHDWGGTRRPWDRRHDATNRGNVAGRPRRRLRTADYWYSRSQRSGEVGLELSPERAFASLRQAELWTPEFPNKAEMYASHAGGLLRETAATEDLARGAARSGKGAGEARQGDRSG